MSISKCVHCKGGDYKKTLLPDRALGKHCQKGKIDEYIGRKVKIKGGQIPESFEEVYGRYSPALP